MSKPNYKGSVKIKNRVSLDSKSFFNEYLMNLFEGYASAKKGSQSRKQNVFIVISNKETASKESKSVKERYRIIPSITVFHTNRMTVHPLFAETVPVYTSWS